MAKPFTYKPCVNFHGFMESPSLWTGFFVGEGISIIFGPFQRYSTIPQFNTMKKTLSIIMAVLLVQASSAQNLSENPGSFTVKWAPTGLVLGSLSAQGEYNFGGQRSLTAKIGLPSSARHAFEYEGKDVDFDMKATSVGLGYRMYLSQKHRKGLYFEPFAKYVHHQSEGIGTGNIGEDVATMSFTNDYKAVGVGAQLGAQFLVGKRFVIDLFFLGPEINSATNNLKAVEVSNTIAWNSVEAQDAEDAIRSFINQFPFVKNRTTITVDQQARTVRGAFKGALPGYRAGVSIGVTL